MGGGLDEPFAVGVGLGDQRILLELLLDQFIVFEAVDPILAEEHLNFLPILLLLA